MSVPAALRGYRTQYLYTLYRILNEDDPRTFFRPEGKEDLDIKFGNGYTELVQVKNLSKTLTFSDLQSKGKTLFKADKQQLDVYKLSGYSREKRIPGYIGEGLLPLYFLNRGYRIKTMDIVPFPNDTHILLRSDLKAKIKSIYRQISKKSIVYDDTILAGLRQDKILDSENRIIL